MIRVPRWVMQLVVGTALTLSVSSLGLTVNRGYQVQESARVIREHAERLAQLEAENAKFAAIEKELAVIQVQMEYVRTGQDELKELLKATP